MQRSNRNDVLKSSRKSDETLKQVNYVGITDVNNPEVLNQIKKCFHQNNKIFLAPWQKRSQSKDSRIFDSLWHL